MVIQFWKITNEDPVLLAPETKEQKPGIATIKAEKSGGGSWHIRDTRELFYSTHHVEVPAQVCNAQVCGAFCPCQKAASRLQKTSVQQVYGAAQQKLSTDKDHN
ncbi:hypothetical protein Peur_003430 [Populus x canadensis]